MGRNKCPDCEKEISDFVLACPNCGRSVDTFDKGRLRPKTEYEKIIEDLIQPESKSDKNRNAVVLFLVVLTGVLIKTFYPSISTTIKNAFSSIRRDSAISVDIAEKPWVEQVLIPGSVSFDVPWPLKRQELPLPPELAKALTRSLALYNEADGLHIAASAVSYAPGTPINLDGAADGAFANIRTVPGNLAVDGKKYESSVRGMRAIELEARIERSRGVPMQLHGIVFLRGNDLISIILISRSDQSLGATVWKRIQTSVRLP